MGRVKGGGGEECFDQRVLVSVACCQVQVGLCRGVSGWCCNNWLVVCCKGLLNLLLGLYRVFTKAFLICGSLFHVV